MLKIVVSFARRAAFLCLAVAVLNLHSATVMAASDSASLPPAGEITIGGSVQVDGAPALTGQTFFPGSTVFVAADSRSTLRLPNRGRLELSAETILKLDFSDEGVAGMLKVGQLRVFAPAGVTTRLTTPDATVLTDSRQPAIFSVETGREGATILSVESGQLEMSAGSRTQLVAAGQMLTTAGSPQPLPNERLRLSGGKKAGLALGVAGLVAMIAIIFSGQGPDEDLCFGGTVTVPGSGTTVFPDPCR